MSNAQRREALCLRQLRGYPGHAPPRSSGGGTFLVSAANYEHRVILGRTVDRMTAFAAALLHVLEAHAEQVHAWCVLPNHYHALVTIDALPALTQALGRLHGRSSHDWNAEDHTRGRQCWRRDVDRRMRSERHFCATLNYVHHNPVHHRLTQRWQDWPFSSARQYLESVGREQALRLWREFPLGEYGQAWDTWRAAEGGKADGTPDLITGS
jgi:putative transposase